MDFPVSEITLGVKFKDGESVIFTVDLRTGQLQPWLSVNCSMDHWHAAADELFRMSVGTLKRPAPLMIVRTPDGIRYWENS